MKNIKFVAAFAASGFILSLLFGLFSHSSILSVLLKALIFCIVFGCLGAVISIIFEKFLLDDSSIELNTESGDRPEGTVKNDSKGRIVDITIKDEELPAGESENHFYVGENRQMLNDSDIGNGNINRDQEEKTVAPDVNTSFRPIRNLETLTNVSGKEAIQPDSNSIYNSQPAVSSASEKDIDTLPDMDGLAFNSESNSDQLPVDDSSDESFTSPVTHSSNRNGEVPEIKDASLYAKAISSVLSQEDK